MKFVLAALIGAVSSIKIQGDYFYARDIGRGNLDKKPQKTHQPNLPIWFMFL